MAVTRQPAAADHCVKVCDKYVIRRDRRRIASPPHRGGRPDGGRAGPVGRGLPRSQLQRRGRRSTKGAPSDLFQSIARAGTCLRLRLSASYAFTKTTFGKSSNERQLSALHVGLAATGNGRQARAANDAARKPCDGGPGRAIEVLMRMLGLLGRIDHRR